MGQGHNGKFVSNLMNALYQETGSMTQIGGLLYRSHTFRRRGVEFYLVKVTFKCVQEFWITV